MNVNPFHTETGSGSFNHHHHHHSRIGAMHFFFKQTNKKEPPNATQRDPNAILFSSQRDETVTYLLLLPNQSTSVTFSAKTTHSHKRKHNAPINGDMLLCDTRENEMAELKWGHATCVGDTRETPEFGASSRDAVFIIYTCTGGGEKPHVTTEQQQQRQREIEIETE